MFNVIMTGDKYRITYKGVPLDLHYAHKHHAQNYVNMMNKRLAK